MQVTRVICRFIGSQEPHSYLDRCPTVSMPPARSAAVAKCRWSFRSRLHDLPRRGAPPSEDDEQGTPALYQGGEGMPTGTETPGMITWLMAWAEVSKAAPARMEAGTRTADPPLSPGLPPCVRPTRPTKPMMIPRSAGQCSQQGHAHQVYERRHASIDAHGGGLPRLPRLTRSGRRQADPEHGWLCHQR